MNNEMYVSRLSVRKAPGQPVTVGVRNADEVQHTVQTIALHGRQQVHGATDWGQFGWNVLGTTSVAAATFGPTVLGTQTVAVTPAGDAFQLIVGDPNSGDQAHVAITLDRRPDQQSFRVPGPAFAFPLHQAVDAQGNIWVTIAGGDKIARLTPAANLAASQYVEFHLPPPPPFAIAWEPVDIDVDSQGIVYATLAAGNAILRFDPSQGSPGTSNGMSIVDLLPCPETECRPPPPPAVEAVLSREPTQMALKETPAGTEVWFTEALADKIGVVRWGPGGTNPLQSHFTCACKVTSPTNPAVSAGTPSGMAIDANGHVWFAGANRNTIARLIPPADPFTTTIANIRHFNIPTGTLIDEPEIGGAFVTAAPHSVALDPAGRVWFTELAQHRVGYLEPWKAVENTTQGMREIDLGKNDFGAFNQPADLTSDPAGTIYTVDEYGDEVNVVTRCGVVNSWRPTERLSFTDQPLVDKQGNLWFLEAGANLITRIAGVAALPGAPDSGAGCDNPPPGGGTPPGGGPTGTPAAAETVACGKRQWAYGTRTAPKVLLLGRTPAQVTKCLGRPTVRRGATWRYGNRILVTFRSGKVRSFTLLNGVFRSKVGNVGVGSRALVLRRISSARVAYNVRTRTYTTFLPVSSRARAQVRYTMRSGRVSRVIVTQVPR
jgi:streptogramin lyase